MHALLSSLCFCCRFVVVILCFYDFMDLVRFGLFVAFLLSLFCVFMILWIWFGSVRFGSVCFGLVCFGFGLVLVWFWFALVCFGLCCVGLHVHTTLKPCTAAERSIGG